MSDCLSRHEQLQLFKPPGVVEVIYWASQIKAGGVSRHDQVGLTNTDFAQVLYKQVS